MCGVFVKYKKYLIVGLLNKSEITEMKSVCEILNIRMYHIYPEISELERDGYLEKRKFKKKGKRNSKGIILTEKGEETRAYFVRRKDELGLTWEEMKNYKGIL